MNKGIIVLISIIIGLAVFAMIAEAGIERIEKIECRQWESDSQKFEGWYSLSWQREQCEHYNIELK